MSALHIDLPGMTELEVLRTQNAEYRKELLRRDHESIVKEAAESGRTLREVAYEKGVDEDTYNKAMDLRKMAQGNL